MSEAEAPIEEGAPQEPPADTSGQMPEQAPAAAAFAGPKRYDVSSKERVVADRMPTMDIVNERFARHFQSGLFTLMRRHADVKPQTLSVQRHGAFMGALGALSHYNIVGMKPLRGNALVVCASPFLYGLVEALYGGVGRIPGEEAAPREISSTEQRVLTRLVKVICNEYARAWKGIHPIEPEYQRTESLQQFATVCGAHEAVVVSAFDITIGDLTGTVHIAVPYTALEPLKDVLYASPLGDSSTVDQRWMSRLTREIQSAEVTLSARLATAEVTIAQLLSMKAGDFIELDREPRIEASVDGVPLFRCHYGTHNAKYALRIDECLNASGENHGE